MNNTFKVYEELISEKLNRVKEMHSLTLVWYDLLTKDAVEEVGRQITERGILIEKAEEIDKKLSEIDVSEFNQNEKKRIDEINKEIRKLKDEMIVCDEKVRALFEKKMQETKDEIREVNAQKKRTVAYGGLDYSVGSMYFNTKS